MQEKVFNILINSKYTPEGVKGAVAGLKSFAEMGTFLRFGLIQPLEQVGRVVVDFIAKANPERIKRFDDAIGGLQTSVGKLLDQALGPTISALSRLAENATALSDLQNRLAPVYDAMIKQSRQAGDSAMQMAEKIKGASDAGVAAAKQEIEADVARTKGLLQYLDVLSILNPAVGLAKKALEENNATLLMAGVNAQDAAVKTETFRNAIMTSARTWDEYAAALARAGIKITNIRDEIDAFNAAKGIKPPSMADNSGILSAVQANEQKLTDVRASAEIDRGRFLDDLATKNLRAQQARDVEFARQREDLARTNAENLRAIDAQYADAIGKANSDLSTSLAKIDADSAQRRLDIEQQYQDQLRSIKESSGASIEDAIERLDARALSKALQSRSQQINDAKRSHDKALEDEARNADQQRAQAQKAADDAKAAAEQAKADQNAAVQKAIADLRAEEKRSNDRALEDQKMADAQAFLDANTANTRKLQDQKRSNDSAVAAEQKKYADMGAAYQKYLDDIANKTKAWQVSSEFNKMLDLSIRHTLSEMFGIQLQ